jgi:hypothetical protein
MAAHPESELQRAIIKWWSFAHRGLGVEDERMLYSVPNGGKRGLITACILKAEGARPGVPDLFLAVPRGGFHGFYLELKSPVGRPSPDQVSFMESARKQGYKAEISKEWNHATSLIESYLRL